MNKPLKLRYSLSLLLPLLLLLSGCGLFGGQAEETPPPPEVTPTPLVIDLPTPTPLPVEPPPGQGVVSLLDNPAAEESLLAGPSADEPPPAVQQPRYAAGAFSFVPPAGWEVVDLGGGALLARRAGADPFTGPANTLPFIYMRPVKAGPDSDTSALLANLDSAVLANLGGVQTTEPPGGIIIDGVKGVWQFAQGRNDALDFRAFLMAIPAGNDTRLHLVIWGPQESWGATAPEMAKVLETMRFPTG